MWCPADPRPSVQVFTVTSSPTVLAMPSVTYNVSALAESCMVGTKVRYPLSIAKSPFD